MKVQLSDHFSYKKILLFTMPSIGMMVFTSIYGVVDGFFVSNYTGAIPFAAVNLILPFIIMISAIGFMIGSGGTALVAFHLGEGDKKRANSVFSFLTYFIIVLGLILMVVGQLVLENVAIALGATEEMLPYCILYGRISLISVVPFMLQNMFQSFLVVAEKPHLGLIITVMAGVTNMLGDYVFVAGFSMGVQGAATATVLSECVGGIVPLIYFALPNKSLLRLGKTVFSLRALGKAAGNGSSEFVANISMSIVSMIYNLQLLKYIGEMGVSAYGVIMYVSFIFVAVFMGYSMGIAPVVGYNYGAGNHVELKNIYVKSKVIIIICSIAMFVLSEALATPLTMLFVGYDPALMALTENAFRICSFAYLVIGVNIFASAFFTGLNNGKISALISFVRTLVFQVIIVLTLPLLLGINGIWWSVFAAEALALIVSITCFIKLKKVYKY